MCMTLIDLVLPAWLCIASLWQSCTSFPGSLYVTARHNPGITAFPTLCRTSHINATSRAIRNTFLNLSYNAITSLPDYAVYNHSGVFLDVDLRHNEIATLGSGALRFGKWPGALALFLTLDFNRIQKLDASGLLQSGNCVYDFPVAVSHEAYVSAELSLSLTGNPVTFIDPAVFTPVPCYTPLSPAVPVLNDTCFAGLDLTLEHVAIQSWDFSWLRPFSGLKLRVYFGHNQITQLQAGAFGSICAQRVTFSVVGNSLAELPDRLFAGLSANQLTVDFSDCNVNDVGRIFDGYVQWSCHTRTRPHCLLVFVFEKYCILWIFVIPFVLCVLLALQLLTRIFNGRNRKT